MDFEGKNGANSPNLRQDSQIFMICVVYLFNKES